jgi:cation transport ATPase
VSDLNSIFYFIIFISISTLFLFSLGSKDYLFNFIASFPIVISIIVLPVFLDWNHNIEPIFSILIVVILIIIAIFNLFSNGIESSLGKHSIKILVLSILSISISYLLLLFSYDYIQYTPDTYIYEFIHTDTYCSYRTPLIVAYKLHHCA